MLNTGSALWKPYQSFPNRLRCFLLANQLEDLKSNMQRILRAEISADTLQQAQYTHNLRNLFPLFLGERYPSLRAEGDSYYQITRQCPLCASRVFHSPLYDIPWLTTCPVHPGESLVETCPRCRREWDKIVAGNPCPVCGTRLPSNALIRQGAYEAEDIDEQLTLLTRMLATSGMGTVYHTDRGGDHYPNFTSCQWRHSLFPSILMALDEQYKPVFKQWQVPLYPCRTVTGSLRPTRLINIRVRNMKMGAQWRESRDTINQRITQYIGKHCGCADTPSGNRMRCPPCLAYHLWKLWTEQERSTHPNHLLRQCYIRRYGNDFPPKPSPCGYIRFASSETCYALPRHAKCFIYEMELWVTYWSFLTRIQSRGSETAFRPAPLKAEDLALGIYRTGNNGLTLIAPLWFFGLGDPLPEYSSNMHWSFSDMYRFVTQTGFSQSR